MDVREKLVELLNHEFGKKVSEITADWLIAHGVTVQEWISVKDRLPSDEKPVLAYYGFMHKENGGTALRYTGTLSYFCFDHQPHWQHESTGLIVTHWMPLPQPPKGE